MADGVVGVKQNTAPDRLIDNEVLTVGAQTVYRQRVSSVPTSRVSTANSVLGVTLGAGATWLGTWEEITDWSLITYAHNGTPAAAVGSVQFEFSFDQTQVDVTAGALTNTGVGLSAPHTLTPVAQFFRLRYTNGNTPLTNFRLQTMLHSSKSAKLTRFPAQTLTDYDDVDFVRAVLSAKDPTGVYRNIEANIHGNLLTALRPNEYFQELGHALGAAEVDTGDWHYVGDHPAMAVFAYFYPAPPSSVIVQWSDDGVTQSAAAVQPLAVQLSTIGIYSGFLSINATSGAYMRVVTTNGATPQIINAAIEYLLSGPYTGVYLPLNAPTPDYEVAMLTKAVLSGQKPDATFANVGLTNQGDLRAGFDAFHIIQFDYTNEVIGIGGSVTSAWVDVADFANLKISTSATQLIEGYVEWSVDATNVNHNYSTPFAGAGDFHIPIGAQYARFRIVNLAPVSSTFNLRVFGIYQATGFFMFPVAAPINDSFPAALTKTITTGKRPSGDYVNVPVGGEVSVISTNSILPANATYTAPVVNCEGYATVGVTIQSDQPSATGGLTLRWVEDVAGAVVLRSVPVTYSSAPDGMFFQVPVQGPYVQLVYVNGIIGQNTFTLHCQFDTASPNPMMQAIREPLVGQNTAMTTRSVTALKDPAGNYPTAKATASGNLAVSLAESTVEQAIKSLSSWRTQQANVAPVTPLQIISSPLSGRRSFAVKNVGTGQVFLGPDSSLTLLNGWPLDSKESIILELDATSAIWAVAQTATGVTASARRSGTTAVNSGATNPNDVLTSNNVRAMLTAAGQSVGVTGLTAPGTYPEIETLKIGFEGRKQSASNFDAVAHAATVTGTQAAGTAVTSAIVTSVVGQFYLAAVTRNAVAASVLSVVGLGLTWTEVTDTTNGTDTRTSIWKATGTPTGDNTVTANLSQDGLHSVISVSRFSGVNLSAPIENFASLSSSGQTNSFSGSINGTNQGMVFVGVGTKNRTHTPGAGYTEQCDVNIANLAALAAETKPITVTGANAYSGTLSGGSNWSLGVVTLSPAALADPVVRLSYSISAVPGASSLTQTLVSATDAEFILNITADQGFTATDVLNMQITVAGTSIGVPAEIDYIFLDIVEAQTGVTQRVAWVEVGT